MDKKEEILKSALKLFAEFGFHATPTSKIAKEAGVANGTLFHYYKTKEELILALYKHTQGELSKYVYSRVSQEDSLEIVFKSVYCNSIEWALENKAEFQFIQQFSSSPFHTLISTEDINSQAAILLDFIHEGIKSADIKPLPADLLQTLINSHISGLAQYLSVGEFSTTKQKKIILQSFEMLWDMIT
ncbi:MAG: transcriptional regulator, TetR family [Bacteroidetes bacterium]|jgi:AcrR family transcriptional regulator|nr:transcriptional regulator, TetR family [Bacteroidota bacterium]MDF2451717.1 transcriptional regulator, TetR family [Bacteroidota bacterium]